MGGTSMSIGGARQMMTKSAKQAVCAGMTAIVAKMLALALAPSRATAGACPLAIVKCGCTISKSGTYTLAGASPMSSGAGTCIHITAGDVTLSGVGTLIQGPGSKTSTIGIQVDIYANKVTLQSVQATNF